MLLVAVAISLGHRSTHVEYRSRHAAGVVLAAFGDGAVQYRQACEGDLRIRYVTGSNEVQNLLSEIDRQIAEIDFHFSS